MLKIDFHKAHLNKKVNLATVSGVATTKTDLISYADKEIDKLSVITTKSFQVRPNLGNREPIICEVEPGCFGNSVGLRNPGMEVAVKELEELRKKQKLKCFLNVSVSADNPDDFITLIKTFDDVADSIELNFSCPHASKGFGASIGCSVDIASDYVKKIKENIPNQKSLLLVKLTPNVDNIGQIAASVIDKGADGIVAINTVGPKLHIDDVSGKPILQNALGGKGGCSGQWVKQRALDCVKEIREAIGSDPIIFGMGGVSTGKDVFNMIKAGADVVGIGSALGKVKQQNWPEYFDALYNETLSFFSGEKVNIKSEMMMNKTLSMKYEEHTIVDIVEHSPDIWIFTLDGKLSSKAGEFAFLWIPGVGEKPFSIADSKTPIFIIKKRGPFTEALFKMKVGQKIYTRGIYGAPIKNTVTKNALLIAGGTGEAVLGNLVEKLKQQKTNIEILVGTSSDNGGILKHKLSKYGKYHAVPDDGKPGRVLDYIKKLENDTAVYIVGPEVFMKKAAEIVCNNGIPRNLIYISMEKTTRCGIGICGECSCGGHLTCQWGTFMSYEFLHKENVL